jgi:hypothetical protein
MIHVLWRDKLYWCESSQFGAVVGSSDESPRRSGAEQQRKKVIRTKSVRLGHRNVRISGMEVNGMEWDRRED